MKQKIFYNLIVMAALNGAAAAVTTNDPPAAAPTIGLEALVAEAHERNPERKFYEAEIVAARAGRKSAGLWANPELSGSIGQKTVRSAGLQTEGVAWSVSVVQPFEWPGRLGLRKAIANGDLELAQLGYERFQVALAGQVRALAYGYFAAQTRAGAAREVAERFQALREVLVQRDPAGLTPLLETRVIEATEVTAQRKAGEAELAAAAALLELNQLRGAAPDAPLTLARPELAFRPAPGLDRLLALARTNNFELRLRALELSQQGARVDLARNERFPAIAVGPSISEERAGEHDRIIGLGVSLPLPLWNRNAGAIDAARARQAQAEVSLHLTGREIQRKVIAAAQTYASKQREMTQWRADAVRQFQDAAELADRHYRLGAVPLATFVELQKQYFEAVESLLATKQEALEAAQQLEQLTGWPAREAISLAPAEKGNL